MKTARTTLLAAGMLALWGLAAAEAQATAKPGPETGAPSLQERRQTEPPQQRLPEAPGSEAEAPSANGGEGQGPHQGCPDQGRKLELIV
jgi:hypothetical protein